MLITKKGMPVRRDSEDSIWKALNLTRSGQLVKATAVLQAMLSGAATADASDRSVPPPTPQLAAPTIEADCRQGAPNERRPANGWPETLKDFMAKATSPSAHAYSNPSKAKQEEIIPAGGRFIGASYRNAAGTRDYKLYIPSSYQEDAAAMPLVIMLHGCTQSPDDFATGTRMNQLAEKEGFLVAYPESTLR